MTANWDSYLCTIDGRPASILVDLALWDKTPMEGYPLLGHAGFEVAAPDAWGFPGEEEYARLAAGEERLAEALCKDDACVYAGRSMSAGRFDCFFYLSRDTARTWLERVRELAETAETAVSEDPGWDCYRAFLYPDERGLLAISNRRACEALAGQGDDPEQSRAVEHLADFASEADALAFAEAVRGRGFAVSAPERQDDGQDNREDSERDNTPYAVFTVRFTRPDRPVEMDAITAPLADLAGEHGGAYRGWSAPVVA